MKLLVVNEKNEIEIKKNAIGLIYESKEKNYNFYAEISEKKIYCQRMYDKSPEYFTVNQKEKLIERKNMAEDFAKFLYDEDLLAWFYKKKYYTKKRF